MEDKETEIDDVLGGTIHVKLGLFKISYETRLAIGAMLFNPYKTNTLVDGEIKEIEVKEFDGRLPSVQDVTTLLNKATDELISRLHINGLKMVDDYKIRRKERFDRKQVQQHLKTIKDKLSLSDSIFGKANVNTQDKTS